MALINLALGKLYPTLIWLALVGLVAHASLGTLNAESIGDLVSGGRDSVELHLSDESSLVHAGHTTGTVNLPIERL